MVDKVKVINARTGEEIRTGSMRNHEINQPLLFGFLTMSDALKIGIAVVSVSVYLIKDNLRISALEDGQKKLTEVSASMQKYMEASDGFHSSIFGTQFAGGRPIDGGFKNKGNISGEGSK